MISRFACFNFPLKISNSNALCGIAIKEEKKNAISTHGYRTQVPNPGRRSVRERECFSRISARSVFRLRTSVLEFAQWTKGPVYYSAEPHLLLYCWFPISPIKCQTNEEQKPCCCFHRKYNGKVAIVSECKNSMEKEFWNGRDQKEITYNNSYNSLSYSKIGL